MTTATLKHGTISGYKYHKCRCPQCCKANVEYQRKWYRLRAYGTWQPLVDADPVRRHLNSLHDQGMTWEQIARGADIAVEEVRRIRMPLGKKPLPKRVRKDRAEKLLAICFKAPPVTPYTLVDSTGTARRLQALRVIGWSTLALAERCQVSRQALGAALRQSLVMESTRAAVAELYEDLRDQDPRRHGVSEDAFRKAGRWAKAQGWAAPNRWVDRDIDDPQAEPGPPVGPRYFSPSAGDRRRAIVEDTAELALLGYDRHAIAERLGITWEAVHRAHRRAGVEVPRILTAA